MQIFADSYEIRNWLICDGRRPVTVRTRREPVPSTYNLDNLTKMIVWWWRISLGQSVAAGDRVGVTIGPHRLNWFDPKSGLNLRKEET